MAVTQNRIVDEWIGGLWTITFKPTGANRDLAATSGDPGFSIQGWITHIPCLAPSDGQQSCLHAAHCGV
jgi:hypothetical protein